MSEVVSARESGVLPRPRPDNALTGEEQYVRTEHEDTLADIAERHGVGYRELRLANPRVDPWLPGEGRKVLLPRHFLLPDAPRRGIVLNVPEMRLYYYPEDEPEEVLSFPVSVGRQDWKTPLGITSLTSKTENPVWYPPASIRGEAEGGGKSLARQVPPGPNNPLGRYALNLALPGYLIHGTNRPYGIGMPVTHGCIRLHPEDMETLFGRVSKGTPVTLVDQPFKVGWHDEVLYLEAHPPLDNRPADLNKMVEAIVRETASVSRFWVNWKHARAIARNPDGLPHPVGKAVRPTAQISRR